MKPSESENENMSNSRNLFCMVALARYSVNHPKPDIRTLVQFRKAPSKIMHNGVFRNDTNVKGLSQPKSVWTPIARGYYCHKGTKYPSQNHKCPRGAYCPTGAAIPIECPEGTFNDQLGGSR